MLLSRQFFQKVQAGNVVENGLFAVDLLKLQKQDKACMCHVTLNLDVGALVHMPALLDSFVEVAWFTNVVSVVDGD